MKAFVIPDIHGSFLSLKQFLELEGLIKDGARTELGEDTYIVSVGDLANCVADEGPRGDLLCLSKVGHWIDQLIVGNHEHPHCGGPTFNGFNWSWDVHFKLMDLARRDLLIPCVNIDGILVSHAGLSQEFGGYGGWKDAATAAATITKVWNVDPIDRFFSTIGASRGGFGREGGLLWSDCNEPRYTEITQIFGHTPGDSVRSNHLPGITSRDVTAKQWYCIDLGGGKWGMPWGKKLAGAWVEDGRIRIVQHDIKEENYD